MTTSYAGGAKQGNFKSIKFDGLLVDRNNIVKLFARGSQLYLRTKHSYDLIVTDYDNHDHAAEDMQLYERVLANPDAKVINIRNDGRFQAYGIGSDEYRELMCGMPITLDASGDEDIIEEPSYFKTFEEARNWAIDNPGKVITRSPNSIGFVPKTAR